MTTCHGGAHVISLVSLPKLVDLFFAVLERRRCLRKGHLFREGKRQIESTTDMGLCSAGVLG